MRKRPRCKITGAEAARALADPVLAAEIERLNPPERVALHEAAHAVVGEALSISVVTVSIVPDLKEGTAGHCTYVEATHDTSEEPWPGWDDYEEWGDEDNRRTIASLAGHEADRRSTPAGELTIDGVCDGDWYEVARHTDSLEEHRLREASARVLVARSWKAIERVAEALLDRRTLSGQDVRSIIEAASS